MVLPLVTIRPVRSRCNILSLQIILKDGPTFTGYVIDDLCTLIVHEL